MRNCGKLKTYVIFVDEFEPFFSGFLVSFLFGEQNAVLNVLE